MKKKKIVQIVKHIKKLNREEEIYLQGKTIHVQHIQKSKKIYSRKSKWNKE